MTVVLGLLVGLAFGVASAFANRRWGTVLACIPVAGWFVILGICSLDGLQDSEVAPLCYGLLGVVLGLLVGQVFDRQRNKRAQSHR